jgi:hypothetical protein
VNLAGYISTNIPTHFRATSEPPPEGPIELHRMDLVRSPSRTYFSSHPPEYRYYAGSTLPSHVVRQRAYDYSGYDTDTGPMGSRAYTTRYHRPPPAPVHSYHHQSRSMFRPDGYDTDSGLISSGRLHMTRTLPATSRMAVIPETIIVNNRMMPASYVRSGSFMNQRNREDNLTGYDTDSSVNTRQNTYGYRNLPVQQEYHHQRWPNEHINELSRSPLQHDRIIDIHPVREQSQMTSIPISNSTLEQDTSVRTTCSLLCENLVC